MSPVWRGHNDSREVDSSAANRTLGARPIGYAEGLSGLCHRIPEAPE